MTDEDRRDAVAHRLIAEYGLRPDMALVLVRCLDEPVISILFYPGHEQSVPGLPTSFRGMRVVRGRIGRAAIRTPRPTRPSAPPGKPAWRDKSILPVR